MTGAVPIFGQIEGGYPHEKINRKKALWTQTYPYNGGAGPQVLPALSGKGQTLPPGYLLPRRGKAGGAQKGASPSIHLFRIGTC
jgi:hypothetical protein